MNESTIRKLAYIHTNSIDSKMANMVQVTFMCQAFVQAGFHVTIYLPFSDSSEHGFDYLKSRFNLSTVFNIIFYNQVDYLGKGLGSLYGLSKVLESMKYSVFYVRDPLIAFYLVSTKRRVAIEFHNSILHRNVFLDFIKKFFLRKYFDNDYLVSIVCISERLKNYWISAGVPNQKIHAFHDGVDYDTYMDEIVTLTAREKLGLDINSKYAVYVGNISLDRGIDKIIYLAKIYQDYIFLVVGGPDKYIKDYLRICSNSNICNVSFVGNVVHSRVKDYLFCADILIGVWSKSISTMEYCSPLKVFEYMASGKLIVCEGFPPIKEVLEDKVTAYLAEPDNLFSLSNAFRLAKNDDHSSLGLNARQLVLSEFTWSIRGKKIKDVMLEHVRI